MAKKLFYFFCLCFVFTAKAQQTFQHKYIMNWNNTASWVDRCSDGGYVIAERSKYGCHYLKTDILGNVLWMKLMPPGVQVDYVEETYDNGYMVLSSYLTGSTLYYYFVKTDASGNMVWDKVFRPSMGNHLLEDLHYFGNGDGTMTLHARETDDHGFIILGQTWDPNTYESQYQLVKLDSAGQLQWTNDYDMNSKSMVMDIEVVRSHSEIDSMVGYIIAGEFIDTASGAGDNDAILTRIDVNGNLVWSKIYTDSSSYYISAFAVKQDADDGFIVTGKITETGLPMEMLCYKVNQSGDVVWSQKYQDPGSISTWGYSVKPCMDGGYIIGGSMKNLTNDHAIMVKVDNAGNVDWARRPYNVYGSDALCILQTPDQGYVFCGQYYLTGVDYAMYLVKTDSLGNSGCFDSTLTMQQSPANLHALDRGMMAPSSIADTTINETITGDGITLISLCMNTNIEDGNNQQGVVLFPNPTTGKFKIANEKSKIEMIQVYNVFGEKVMSSPCSVGNGNHENARELDISNQPSGVYVVEVVSGNTIMQGKIVKQ